MHAGGRDVLLALERRFELDGDAFRYSAAMLREYGNLSSAFVYFVLEAALADDAPGRLVVAVVVRRRLQLPRRAAARRLIGARASHGDADARPRAGNARPPRARRSGGAALAPRPAPRQRLHGRAPHPGARAGAAPLRRAARRAAAHRRARLRRRPADARRRAPPRRRAGRREPRPARSPADRRRRDDRRLRRRRLARRAASWPTCWTGPTAGPTARAGTSSSPTSSCTTSTAPALQRLLAACARRADALVACEPRRSRFALAASHLIFFLGANAVTRHDGVLSVRAGFVDDELGAAWPGDAGDGGSTSTTTACSRTASCAARRATVAMKTRFDVAVVGAGPAGASAAILLARAGWSVALIERQPFPRRKVCGECIAASNLRAARRARRRRRRSIARAGAELRRVALMRGRRHDRRAAAGRRRSAHRWGRALGREHLDTLLADAAEAAGATRLQPCALQAIGGAAGALLACACGRSATGADVDLQRRPRRRRARLVGAAARRSAPSAARPARRATCSPSRRTSAAPPSPPICCRCSPFAGGYGGMVVADDGLATLACCVRADRLQAAARARAGPARRRRRRGDAARANAPASPTALARRDARRAVARERAAAPRRSPRRAATASFASATPPARRTRSSARASAWRCSRRSCSRR